MKLFVSAFTSFISRNIVFYQNIRKWEFDIYFRLHVIGNTEIFVTFEICFSINLDITRRICVRDIRYYFLIRRITAPFVIICSRVRALALSFVWANLEAECCGRRSANNKVSVTNSTEVVKADWQKTNVTLKVNPLPTLTALKTDTHIEFHTLM